MKGAVECLSDFLFIECYFAWSLEIISIICLGIAIYLILRKRYRKLKNNSTKMLMLIILSLIFYFIYNLNRMHRTYYFLEELFFQVYQAFLIFYFGKKLAARPNQGKNLVLIKIIFFTLIILDITTFILSIIEALSRQQMCKQISFTIFRSVSLITQILFLIVVQKLNKKFQQILLTLSTIEQQTKKQKQHFFYLKILCYLSLIGSIISLIVNFIYMMSPDCRIISHFGDDGQNFSDALNTIVHAFVKVMTYFLPIILTLAIFITKRQKQSQHNFSLEAEDLSGQFYFKSLSLTS